MSVNDARVSPYEGIAASKLDTFIEGLAAGLRAADGDPDVEIYFENDHTLGKVARRVTRSLIEWTASLALFLLALGCALYAIASVVYVIQIAATDWDGSHFSQHVALLIAATLFAWAYFTGRLSELTKKLRGTKFGTK